MKKFLSILTVLLFVFATGANFVNAAAPTVTAATGGNAISADTCSTSAVPA